MLTKTLIMHTQYPEAVEQLLSERDCIKQQNGYIAVGPQPGVVTIGYTAMAFATCAEMDIQVWVAHAQGCGLIQDCVESTREKQ
jgi:hypothetical protein